MRLPRSIRYTLNAKRFRGFTLIELLVVITIISILLSMGTYSYTNAQRKGRDGKRKADLKTVQQALELYYQDNGAYPPASSGKIQCNVGGIPTQLEWGGTAAFACDEPGTTTTQINYLDKLPKDPKGAVEYLYTTSGSPINTYTISAVIENSSDPDVQSGALPCTVQGGSGQNYCVKNP